MIGNMTTLASDVAVISRKLAGRNLDLARIQSAVKDLRNNQGTDWITLGNGLPEVGGSIKTLVEGIQEKLLGIIRTEIPDAQPETLPMQMPLRDIIDDGETLTFIFQQTENSDKVHFVYQIDPNGDITFKERKEIPVIKTLY